MIISPSQLQHWILSIGRISSSVICILEDTQTMLNSIVYAQCRIVCQNKTKSLQNFSNHSNPNLLTIKLTSKDILFLLTLFVHRLIATCPHCNGNRLFLTKYTAPLEILKARSWLFCKDCWYEIETDDFKKQLWCT